MVLAALLRAVVGLLVGAVAVAAVTVGAYVLVHLVGPLLRYLPLAARVRFAKEPVPPTWAGIVSRNVPLSRRLSPAQLERLLRLAQVFVRDHAIEGCQGLEVTEEVKVTIAAQACLLLLNLRLPCYPKLRRVLVHPGVFASEDVRARLDKAVQPETHALLGQAWHDGVVVLSWDSALIGCLNLLDGSNVILHEVAHVLDQEDGAFDGFPILDSPSAYRTWGYVMREEYAQQLRWTRKHKPVLDSYAATNRAEFFAVATEAFFEKPLQLRQRNAALYDELRQFYRQNPAATASPSDAADGGRAG